MFILENVRLIPELSSGHKGICSVVVEGKKISAIIDGWADEAQFEEAVRIDCNRKTLLPGLIDAHMHLIFGPLENETPEFADKYFELFIKACKKAEVYLKSGYTTVRDVASSYGVANSVRDAVEDGVVVGPRIISAGHIIGATEERKIVDKDHNVVADGCDGVQRAVRREIAHGADIIKIYAATYPLRRDKKPVFPMYTEEELKMIVDTASSLGTYVAAHVYTAKAINMCLDAGVYTIEHGGGVDDKAIEKLKKQKAFLIPTLAPNIIIANSQEDSEEFKTAYFERLANGEIESLKLAYSAGLKLGFGTDISNGLDKGYEFLARKEYIGMSNIDMLLQATKNNAEILGLNDVVGEIKEGLEADLILVDGNPDENINVMTSAPVMVFARGKRIE